MQTYYTSYVTGANQKLMQQTLHSFAHRALANDIQAVRLPGSYKGQKHMPGYFWMSRMKALVAYESRLESTILLQLDYHHLVRRVIAQPFELHYTDSNRSYLHVPDFLAVYENGTAEVINVKPQRFIHSDSNARAFHHCEQAASQLGWAYSTRCEMPTAQLLNLKWLGGYRLQPAMFAIYSAMLLDVIKASDMPIPISVALARCATVHCLLKPVLFHMIWIRQLDADLSQLLSDGTLLHLGVNA